MKFSIGGLVLVMAFVLSFVPAAQAQKEHSMTGCLEKNGDNYQLTHLEKGPATVPIEESSVNLAPHVGHKVTITGTRDPNAPGHTMKVTAMKHVSATCP